ncbi:hypothetical protein QUF61_04365 [Candidatus Venteria ishoeyi]|uniref:hypothetical protein n=1 Tax=Candidatus Venteria ishoeyi TaxID=1899563 RepID=UPI0025A673A7|nr:hypothetical protein [Candidatus Venteria ishoeyi]MDM8545710.1 hypothetical protein [Candidatus Venteria ishoeyi]
MDKKYLKLFLDPIKKCKTYKPKLGTNDKNGVDLSGFKTLYGEDPFYAWIGLDSDLMYAAHKAAGGMTSVYRQVGVGCERLFRQIIIDTARYENPSLAEWSYMTKTSAGKDKKLSLDGRLEFSEIKNIDLKSRLNDWVNSYCNGLDVQKPSNGVVFEVRQGYKSKDSKRQNGDIDNASVAWAKGYLPVFSIFSSQIDGDIVTRYRNSRCGILVGIPSDNSEASLFAFCQQVLGYDLADFFKRNSGTIKAEVTSILEALLNPQ